MKEVKLGRVVGPYRDIPFENYMQSPIGLVPKAGGDHRHRLIFHMSYDFSDGLRSLNFHTPKEKCSVKYKDLDYTVWTYLDLWEYMQQDIKPNLDSMNEELRGSYWCGNQNLRGKWREKFGNDHKRQHEHINATPIYAGKSDMKSAFHVLGLSRASWKWLIMKARDPNTKEWYYFVDKCLPFGVSISCALFQRFSDALCFLMEARLQVQKRITNYLDDFLFIARTLLACNFMIKQFLQLCEEIGVPVDFEKTEWASKIITFLGILLDGRNRILAIPIDKKEAAELILRSMIDKKKATASTRNMQQLLNKRDSYS